MRRLRQRMACLLLRFVWVIHPDIAECDETAACDYLFGGPGYTARSGGPDALDGLSHVCARCNRHVIIVANPKNLRYEVVDVDEASVAPLEGIDLPSSPPARRMERE